MLTWFIRFNWMHVKKKKKKKREESSVTNVFNISCSTVFLQSRSRSNVLLQRTRRGTEHDRRRGARDKKAPIDKTMQSIDVGSVPAAVENVRSQVGQVLKSLLYPREPEREPEPIADSARILGAVDRLSSTLRGMLSACEVDISNGSVSFSSAAPRPQSFVDLHDVLRDRLCLTSLFFILACGGISPSGDFNTDRLRHDSHRRQSFCSGPWVRRLKKSVTEFFVSGNTSKSITNSPSGRDQHTAERAVGEASYSHATCTAVTSESVLAASNVKLGKSIALFISDGVIALQGSRALQSQSGAFGSPTDAKCILRALCEALGDPAHSFAPFISQVIRVLAKLKPLLILSFELDSNDEDFDTPESNNNNLGLAGRRDCVVSALLRLVASTSDSCTVHETWACLRAVLFANKSLTSGYLVDHLEDFARAFVSVLRPPLLAGSGGASRRRPKSEKTGPNACRNSSSGREDDHESEVGDTVVIDPSSGRRDPVAGSWHVNCRQALKTLSVMLGDSSFGKGRTRLADCPALFAATLGVVGFLQQRRLNPSPAAVSSESPMTAASLMVDGFTHDVLLLYECYHVLKVYIAKPRKAMSVRFLLTANRDAILHFLTDYHTIAHTAAAVSASREGNDEDGAESASNEQGARIGADDADEDCLAREAERKLLMNTLVNTEPLNTDEMYTLRHFLEIDLRPSNVFTA